MSSQGWVELLPTDQANNGTTISNSTTETILFPDFTIPASYLNDNKFLRYTARGKLSNIVTTPGTLTFALRLGGVSGTLIAQTSAISLNIVAQTDIMFEIVIDIISRGNGTTSPILAMGKVELAAQLAGNNNQPNFMGSAGGASGNTPATVNVDTTQNQALSLTAKFSIANAGNAITGMIRSIETLK